MHKITESVSSVLLALVMTAEAAALPVSADGAQPIDIVSFANVNTMLTIGEVPDYTAYLLGDTALHASILNEGWGCTQDMSIHAAKSEGLPVPDEPAGVPYSYLIALTADTGWYFPENITLYYDGTPIDSSEYTATVTNEGQVLMIQCDFIPQITPIPADAQTLSAVRITNVRLDYAAGDAPVFSGTSAEPEKYSLFYERWVDDSDYTKFNSNNEELNAYLGLTEENRLTAFEADGQYHYDLCIQAEYGYIFADDVTVYVNNQKCTVSGHTLDMIPINEVASILVAPPVTTAETTTTETTTTTSKTTTAKETATTTKETTTAAKITTTARETTTAAETTSAAVSRTATSTVPPVTYTVESAVFDENLLYGDVNGDGRVSIADAALLMRFVTEDTALPQTNLQLSAGDLDLDGLLTVLDVRQLLQKLLTADTQTVVPPLPAASDDTAAELPDLPVPTWLIPNEGNSAPLQTQPFDWLIVTAEKDAFSYDGQLQIRALTDEETTEMDALTEDYGIMLDGWHVDAGLAPDERLPGQYSCSYDLSQLDIPEELYDDIIVQRVADDGGIQEYSTKREGSVLSWMTNQNSFTLIILGGALVLGGAVAATLAIKDYVARKLTEWDCKLTYSTPYCTIFYADEEHFRWKNERQTKMKAMEDAAKQQAKATAEKELKEEWKDKSVPLITYTSTLNRRTARYKHELLEDNEEYQKLKAADEGYPADVLLLGHQVQIAAEYLEREEGCPTGGIKPDVIFTTDLEPDGEAVTPFFADNYLVIKRQRSKLQKELSPVDPALYPEYNDLYGVICDKKLSDDTLITVTHEYYHRMQAIKMNLHTAKNIKFSEMSAKVVEHRCAEYYKNSPDNIFTAYPEDKESTAYMTYGLAIDDNSDASALTYAGYTLSGFWEYLEASMKRKFTGWEIICGYKQYGSISAAMNNMFGFAQLAAAAESPNQYKYLNMLWEAYHNIISNKALAKAAEDFPFTSNTETHYPFLMRKITLDQNSPAEQFKWCITKAENLTCTGVGIQNKSAGETGGWSVIAVRNKNFGEMQPEHQFLIPSTLTHAESKSGLVMTTKGSMMYYRERRGYGAVGTSNYMLYLIPAPQTPAIEIDEEAEVIKIKLQSAQSRQSELHQLTDRFLLCFELNGQEALTIPIEFAEWDKEITVLFADLHLSMEMKNDLKISVCEMIDAEGEYPTVRTAASDPFEKLLGEAELPELDVDTRCGGRYGGVYVDDMNGHFTLNKSGQFTLTLEDYSYRPSSNPFVDQKLGLWECNGFSVSGTVDKDIEDPAEFDGKLSSDSISLSGSHSMTTAYVYEDDSDTEGKLSSENRKWQTSGSGASIGTIHYKFDTATGYVTVTLTMDIPMHCEVTTTSRYIGYEDPVIKTEENDMTEASVVLKFTFKMP